MAKENMGDTFGILNPCHEKKTIGPSLDPAKVETKDLLQRTVLELFNKNAASGQGKLKGILLERPKQTLNSLCSWAKITGLSDVEKSITGAKVRIPEIHASYPNPCSYGDADHADSGIIALYPTFYFESEEAQRQLQSKLKPGDLVWVDFEDRTNLKNGVITGMVKGGSGVQELCDKIGKMHNNKTAGRQNPAPDKSCPSKSQSEYSNATWVGAGCANFNPANRQPKDIKRIVLHTVGGRGRAHIAINMFKSETTNPRKVSSHYVIEGDGKVTQMVKHKDIANHAKGNNPDTIGIEHGVAGGGNTPWNKYAWIDKNNKPTSVMRASAELTAFLCKELNIVPSTSTIILHKNIHTQRKDPGPHFNLERYIEMCGG